MSLPLLEDSSGSPEMHIMGCQRERPYTQRVAGITQKRRFQGAGASVAIRVAKALRATSEEGIDL